MDSRPSRRRLLAVAEKLVSPRRLHAGVRNNSSLAPTPPALVNLESAVVSAQPRPANRTTSPVSRERWLGYRARSCELEGKPGAVWKSAGNPSRPNRSRRGFVPRLIGASSQVLRSRASVLDSALAAHRVAWQV